MDSTNTNFRVSTKHKVVVIPHDSRIEKTIPHAKPIEKAGRRFQIVPHRVVETKLLNNCGYAVPAPILVQYDWCSTTPFESQRDTARLLTTHRRAYVLNDMGTGKTRASLYACDFLMGTGHASRALVIAPLSTLTTVWEREIFECFPHRSSIALHGTRQKRLQMLAEERDFYIINHDGVGVVEEALRARPDIDIIIIDELALLRNARTDRWKATNRVCKDRKFVWGMTGSPIPKEPTDAYGQVKLITPDRAPKFFKQFKDQTMFQVSQFRWIARKNALDTVYKLMQPSVRYNREDCMDLPETMYTTLECNLTAEQQKAYDDMREECEVSIAEALLAGESITAANAGVQFSKMIQIASGFVYGTTSTGVKIAGEFDDAPRYKLLEEVIEETDRKVIVFAPFIHLVNTLAARLKAAGHAVASIHGQTSKADRDEAFISFQNSSTPTIIVAHPQTMSHGLTLTAANTIVWYSPVFSLETYEQANARITRPGQDAHTHIVHIESTPIEKRVYNTLRTRGSMQKALLELFRGPQGSLI